MQYYKTHFFFLDCTKFSFELVNQKTFEINNVFLSHLIYFAIFHLKVIVYQNFNLPHTYGHHPKKHPCVI